jgi:hypothetical protein
MLDIVFAMGFLIGAGYIFVSVTDYKQIVTKWYGTRRRGSLGIKSISGNVRQMRIWLFVMGVCACSICLLGIFAPSH